MGLDQIGMAIFLLISQQYPIEPATSQAQRWGQIAGRLVAYGCIVWLLMTGIRDVKVRKYPPK